MVRRCPHSAQECKWRELEEQRQAQKLQRQLQLEQTYLLALHQPPEKTQATQQHSGESPQDPGLGSTRCPQNRDVDRTGSQPGLGSDKSKAPPKMTPERARSSQNLEPEKTRSSHVVDWEWLRSLEQAKGAVSQTHGPQRPNYEPIREVNPPACCSAFYGMLPVH